MLGFLSIFVPVMFMYTFKFMRYFVKFAWYGIAVFLVISLVVPSLSFWGGVTDATSFFMQTIPEHIFMFFITISDLIDYDNDAPTAAKWALGLTSFAFSLFGMLLTATYYVSFVLVTFVLLQENADAFEKREQEKARAVMSKAELKADDVRLRRERETARRAPRAPDIQTDPNDEMLMYGLTDLDEIQQSTVQANAIAKALREQQ